MATEFKRRRGTTAEHAVFTGAEGEITIDTDKDTAIVHDGATLGGFELARADLTNVNLSGGVDAKNSVRAATTDSSDVSGFVYEASDDNETVGAAPWTSVTAPVFDGITLIDGDRVLIKDSADAKGNGIFTYDDGANTFIRADDADNSPGAEVSGGMHTFVEEGSTLADSGWVMSEPNGVATLGTDDLEFTQFSGSGSGVSAGNGLTKTGSTIDVVGTSNRISVSADAIDISSNYVGQTSITTLGTIANFASTGIDDNAGSTAITIDSNQRLGVNQATPLSPLHVENNSISIIVRSQTDQNIDVKTYFSSNPNVGTAAAQTVELNNGANGLQLSYYSTGFTPSGSKRASGGRLQQNGVGGLSLVAEHGSGDIRLYTGGSADGNERMNIDQSGNTSFGIADGDGFFHIHAASSGATANSSANTLVVEGTGTHGISILSETDGRGEIYFGDSDNSTIGQIRYQHSNDRMFFHTGGTNRMGIHSGGIGMGTVNDTPLGSLHVREGDSTTVAANSNAKTLVLENNATGGLSILTPNNVAGRIYFGDPDDNDVAKITYDHSTEKLQFSTVGNGPLWTMTGLGLLGLRNATSPVATLDIQNAGGEVHVARFHSSAPTIYWETNLDTRANFRIGNQQGVDKGLDISVNSSFGAGSTSDDAITGTGGYTMIMNIKGDTRRVGIGTSGSPAAKLHVQNESTQTGDGVLITNDSVTASAEALSIVNSTLSGGSAIKVASNSGRILDGNSTAQSQFGITATHTHASFNSRAFDVLTTRVASNAFIVYSYRSNAGADTEFKVDGTGQIFSDAGTTITSPADYADYFEWADGNPDNEDRVGYAVISNAEGKVEMAYLNPGVEPIGIVSGNPTVAGNSFWNHWQGKYLRDRFNRNARNDAGEKVLSPDFDPDLEYISREDRPEWDPIGLVGRLAMYVGQPAASTWVKLADIDSEVEEWLVK